MKPLPALRPPLPVFRGRLHDARTATVIGRALGVAVAVCFVTGVISHYLQQPPGWAADVLPTRPVWGYRLTQGLHVASGIAAIPLVLAKLWTVYPRLFTWPPVTSVAHALERLSIGVLVSSILLEIVTGLLDTAQWYPWPFPFRQTHWALAWVAIGALLLHIAVKAPVIAGQLVATAGLAGRGRRGRRGPPVLRRRGRRGGRRGDADHRGPVVRPAQGTRPAGPQAARPRPAVPAGQPYGGTGRRHRRPAGGLPAARHRAAAVRADARLSSRRCGSGRAVLPIACVEGWSRNGHWTGVRLRDLLDRAGAPHDARVRVVSLERGGHYAVSVMGASYARDPLTLLALSLNGQPLDHDHGYPARVIAPNRPGVLQTKWVTRLEVLGSGGRELGLPGSFVRGSGMPASGLRGFGVPGSRGDV